MFEKLSKNAHFGLHSEYRSQETELYYLQSRYYDPQVGRFINADSYVSTGQGFLGNNMYLYCLNNPASFIDVLGMNPAAAIPGWLTGLWWLPYVDGPLPIGEIILIGGLLIFVATSDHDNSLEITYDDTDVGFSPPPQNNNEDDDDDDYYDDDSNFGGPQKVGKTKGNTPKSNKQQNKDFEYAANKAGVPLKNRRAFHDYVTGQGFGKDELIEIAKTFVSFLLGIFGFEEEDV